MFFIINCMAEEQNSYYREAFGSHIMCRVMHFKKEAPTKMFGKNYYHIVLDLIP